MVEVGGGGEENIRQTLALLEQEGLDVSDVHTAIISHTHADHMGAIAYFRERVEINTQNLVGLIEQAIVERANDSAS